MGKSIKLRLNWLPKLRKKSSSSSSSSSLSSESSSSPQLAQIRCYSHGANPGSPSPQSCYNYSLINPPPPPSPHLPHHHNHGHDFSPQFHFCSDSSSPPQFHFCSDSSSPPQLGHHNLNPPGAPAPSPSPSPSPSPVRILRPTTAPPALLKLLRSPAAHRTNRPSVTDDQDSPRHGSVASLQIDQKPSQSARHVTIASLVDCHCSASSRFTRLSKGPINSKHKKERRHGKTEFNGEPTDEIKKKQINSRDEGSIDSVSNNQEDQSAPLLKWRERKEKIEIKKQKMQKKKKQIKIQKKKKQKKNVVMNDVSFFNGHGKKKEQATNDLTRCDPRDDATTCDTLVDGDDDDDDDDGYGSFECPNPMDPPHSYPMMPRVDSSFTSEDNLFSASSLERRDVATTVGRPSFSSSSSSDLCADPILKSSIVANHIGILPNPRPSPLIPRSVDHLAPSTHRLANDLSSIYSTDKPAPNVPSHCRCANASDPRRVTLDEMKIYHNEIARRGRRKRTSRCDIARPHNSQTSWNLVLGEDHQQSHHHYSPHKDDDDEEDNSSWGSSFCRSMDGESRINDDDDLLREDTSNQGEFSEGSFIYKCKSNATRMNSRSYNSLPTLDEGSDDRNASKIKVRKSVAMVKSSSDPLVDFRDSMIDMILENQIYSTKGLEDLLHGFLALNSKEHHGTIVKAFAQVWEKLFE